MYEDLTSYIEVFESKKMVLQHPRLASDDYESSMSDPEYAPELEQYLQTLYQHEEIATVDYFAVLEKHGGGYDSLVQPESVCQADLELVFALLLWPTRAERFCPGTLGVCAENGDIVRCL